MIDKSFEEKNSENEIRNKITLITFVCSVLVIYIHAYNLVVYGIDENSSGLSGIVYVIENYWSKVLKIAVPMFFFISGLLFFRNLQIKDLPRKWKKRFFTVIIPYFIWCTLYYIYNVMCTNIPMIHNRMNQDTVTSLSLKFWLGSLWNDSYYTLWFLKNLILFICMAPIIWLLIKNHWKRVPTGLIALIIIEIFINKELLKTQYGNGLDSYLVGSYIGLNCSEYLSYRNKKISGCAFLYIIFCMITSFRFWNIVTKSILFIAIWFACDWVSRKERSFPWWMKITFFTYVSHDIFLEALEKLFLILFGVKPIFALLDYLLMPLVVQLLLVVIAFFMQKCSPVMWRILTGDRGCINGNNIPQFLEKM